MKTITFIEVVVVFVLTLSLVALAGLSPLGAWVRQASKRAYIEYAVMIAVPLILLAITRRHAADSGLSLQNPRYHLDIAATAFVPVALASVPLAYFDKTHWDGALIMVVAQLAVLFLLGWLLKRKPTRNESSLLTGASFLIAGTSVIQKATLGSGISAFVFYIFFVGLGEELLFRGYIQSRLNAAWGRPFQFFGVSWGWGMIITAALFGIMHVLNTGSLINGNWQVTGWWGLWTFFGGLVLGFVREKTGSIAAPTILHGLPQAIASAFLGI